MSQADGQDKSNRSDLQGKAAERDNKAVERQQRLSQALRDNLRRRKSQMRARKAGNSSEVQVAPDTKASDRSEDET